MTEKNEAISGGNQRTVFSRIGRGVLAYLSDWRNLLGHGLLGVVLLVVAIWAPVDIWIKLVVVGCLVCFNVWRMRRSAHR